VHCAYRWIVEGDGVLGGIALRHASSDYVLGPAASVSTSGRPRVGAGWPPGRMGRMLDEARVLGLDRALAVCAVDSVASVKMMERCGSVFEGIRDAKFGPARRYWIELKRWAQMRFCRRPHHRRRFLGCCVVVRFAEESRGDLVACSEFAPVDWSRGRRVVGWVCCRDR
jgi:hypothetical protein